MFLKTAIVLLLIAMLISLSAAFFTLMRDQGRKSGRTARLLTLRVSIATLTMLLIGYGMWTGDLTPSAPWDP